MNSRNKALGPGRATKRSRPGHHDGISALWAACDKFADAMAVVATFTARTTTTILSTITASTTTTAATR